MPLFGRVVDIRWKANLKANCIRRIIDDVSLKEKLIRLNEDVIIRSFSKYGYWAIVSRRYKREINVWALKQAASREQWDFYVDIAHHLLESSKK